MLIERCIHAASLHLPAGHRNIDKRELHTNSLLFISYFNQILGDSLLFVARQRDHCECGNCDAERAETLMRIRCTRAVRRCGWRASERDGERIIFDIYQIRIFSLPFAPHLFVYLLLDPKLSQSHAVLPRVVRLSRAPFDSFERIELRRAKKTNRPRSPRHKSAGIDCVCSALRRFETMNLLQIVCA